MERKAALYDKLARGEYGSDEDEEGAADKYNVDFFIKSGEGRQQAAGIGFNYDYGGGVGSGGGGGGRGGAVKIFSPRDLLRSVPVLATTSSTSWCSGAPHVIHHMLYRCSARHPPQCKSLLLSNTSSYMMWRALFIRPNAKEDMRDTEEEKEAEGEEGE